MAFVVGGRLVDRRPVWRLSLLTDAFWAVINFFYFLYVHLPLLVLVLVLLLLGGVSVCCMKLTRHLFCRAVSIRCSRSVQLSRSPR